MRMDVAVGMAFSIMIMSSLIVTTAGSLHTKGITDISTAQEAAESSPASSKDISLFW